MCTSTEWQFPTGLSEFKDTIPGLTHLSTVVNMPDSLSTEEMLALYVLLHTDLFIYVLFNTKLVLC